MTTLADWIGYGRRDRANQNKRMVRRWIKEAREHRPVIDRVNYPDNGVTR